MKTEHLDLEIKKLTHSQNYEGITETQQKRLNEFIDIKKQLALCSVVGQSEQYCDCDKPTLGDNVWTCGCGKPFKRRGK